MGISRTNLLLAAALAVSLVCNFAMRIDPSLQGLEFAPQMAHTARYAAFASNPNFPDGQTLRTPVPGTIARGQPPLGYTATPADAARAGLELQSPVASNDAAAKARGATVYLNFCQPCHGTGGRGDGPIAQRGVPPPPSLVAEHAVGLRDGQMFHLLTFGQGNMASYASLLSRDDRWKAVAYIRSLQQAALPAPAPTSTPATPPVPAPAEGGARP